MRQCCCILGKVRQDDLLVKKYKHCCLEKDNERFRHSSAVAGVTVEELQANLDTHLTADVVVSKNSNSSQFRIFGHHGDEQVGAFLVLSFGTFEPVGGLVAHHTGNLASHVKLADAIRVMLRSDFVAGR